MELGLGRALFRTGGGGRHHHREGRPDLRLDPLPDHARSSRSRSTTRCASATPSSMSGSRRPGFMLDWGDDGSGLFMKYMRRGSGYYIDVGASQLIVDGKIKLKAGQRRRAHRGLRGACRRHRAAGRSRRLRHRLRLDERLGRGADQPGGRRQGRQGAGAWAPTPPRIPGRGKASCATCGSRPSRRRCGSTAATCTSRATIRSSWRCSSRRGRRAFATPVYKPQEVHHLS